MRIGLTSDMANIENSVYEGKKQIYSLYFNKKAKEDNVLTGENS